MGHQCRFPAFNVYIPQHQIPDFGILQPAEQCMLDPLNTAIGNGVAVSVKAAAKNSDGGNGAFLEINIPDQFVMGRFVCHTAISAGSAAVDQLRHGAQTIFRIDPIGVLLRTSSAQGTDTEIRNDPHRLLGHGEGEGMRALPVHRDIQHLCVGIHQSQALYIRAGGGDNHRSAGAVPALGHCRAGVRLHAGNAACGGGFAGHLIGMILGQLDHGIAVIPAQTTAGFPCGVEALLLGDCLNPVQPFLRPEKGRCSFHITGATGPHIDPWGGQIDVVPDMYILYIADNGADMQVLVKNHVFIGKGTDAVSSIHGTVSTITGNAAGPGVAGHGRDFHIGAAVAQLTVVGIAHDAAHLSAGGDAALNHAAVKGGIAGHARNAAHQIAVHRFAANGNAADI